MTRRARKDSDFRRRRPSRQPYGRVLLLFEDSVVAPQYFKDIRTAWGLHPENIKIPAQNHGNDPESVVRAALQWIKSEGSDAFDKVYCLVDRDKHQTFEQACALVRDHQHGKSGLLSLIISNPCFEVWVLSHFTGSTKPMKAAAVPGSDCDEIASELRRTHWPTYQKGQAGMFAHTESLLEQAKIHTKRWKDHHANAGGDGNPSSEIFLVIEHLERLRQEKGQQ